MVHKSGTNDPHMSAVANVEHAQGFARRLEEREAVRSGAPLSVVRPVVARRIGISPGTLENLRRGRLKDVRKGVFDSLRAGVIQELEAEMRRCEHELAVLRQIGTDPRSDEISSVEASLASAREALGIA